MYLRNRDLITHRLRVKCPNPKCDARVWVDLIFEIDQDGFLSEEATVRAQCLDQEQDYCGEVFFVTGKIDFTHEIAFDQILKKQK